MDRAQPPPELNHLERALQTASDGQIVRILGVVDGMEARESADALIAPLRDRLGRLGLKRPLRFARLLFAPTEPLLVPARSWVRGGVGVPRSALGAAATQVRQDIDGTADFLEAMIRRGLAGDEALVGRAGAVLWPAAAEVLERALPPPDWGEWTGLGCGDHGAICRCLAAVLSEASWLAGRVGAAAEGELIEEPELRAWLEAATARHSEPEGALLVVLLARLPQASALLGPAPPQTIPGVPEAEPAIDFLLGRLGAAPEPGSDLGEASATVRRAAALMEAMEASGRSLRGPMQRCRFCRNDGRGRRGGGLASPSHSWVQSHDGPADCPCAGPDRAPYPGFAAA